MTLPAEATTGTRAVVQRRSECRGCGSSRLSMFLSLGQVPLANSFLRADQLTQPEARYPLDVYYCAECSLVQLLDVVDPRVLFSNYVYRTGTNQTIVQHNRKLADAVVDELSLRPTDLVVEVASNDGSLLQCFRDRDIRTLGVEPAHNIAEIAREAGIDTVEEFFNTKTAAAIVDHSGPASAVIANNVLAHVDDTVDFLTACRNILQPEGHVVIEVPYLKETLDRLEYDTIYHEHLCYFSINALMRMFAEASLGLVRVDHVPIHGGSLRLWAARSEHGHSNSVRNIASNEVKDGLTSFGTYEKFGRAVHQHRDEVRALFAKFAADKQKIVGYGAPAKGNTLLCFCGIDTQYLPYTADRSPLKMGLYTPGTHIPVVPVERIFEDQPEYVFLLAWNFAEEIMQTLTPYRQRGGRFVLPIPQPTIR